MKNYFMAYRFSGETPETLKERTKVAVEALGRAGISAYCNLHDQKEYQAQGLSNREIMEKAFAKIDESDGLFVLIASSDKSEGQLMEVGYAFAKGKPIIVAVQNEAKTYVNELADQTISWHDLQDLSNQLGTIKL